jgi:2-polyprenyl-3-methyl-5-hydroxy-6-metoxy-1,4-benzoquinol methylase
MQNKNLRLALQDIYQLIEHEFNSANAEELTALGDLYKDFNKNLVNLLSSKIIKRSGRNIENANGISSRQFMIDILVHIREYLIAFPPRTRFSVLDVGCGSGYGTELLASLYTNTTLGYKLNITGLDINSTYKPFMDFFHKNINFLEKPLQLINEKYSIVICNQVIEHVDDPVNFIKDLLGVCSGRLFVTTPFEEPIHNLSKGHKNSFSIDFIHQTKPLHWEVYISPAWGSSLSPPYKTLLAIYSPD